MTHLFTSESVTKGHPDKVSDQVSDAILDACLAGDPHSRVACETLTTTDLVVVAGEITTGADLDAEAVVREVVCSIGYDREELRFDGNTCEVQIKLDEQSTDISQGVTEGKGLHVEQGAGDQGMMFGYACMDTDALMPAPIHLSHRLMEQLTEARESGDIGWLRPDGKGQVTIAYDEAHKPVRVENVVLSTQHDPDVSHDEIRDTMVEAVIRPVLPDEWVDGNTVFHVNPTGRFVIGGPHGDCGLTGRKIIVDTYGGRGRHGGGAFSGKDPSKVDRSAAYAARWVAKNLVAAGACTRCEVSLCYAIGVAEPLAIEVDVEDFGTAVVDKTAIDSAVRDVFDLRPAGIIDALDLRRPIFRATSYHGHFGRDGFSWEETNRVDEIRATLGL
jgi:S-adenosylmethionine synthetase